MASQEFRHLIKNEIQYNSDKIKSKIYENIYKKYIEFMDIKLNHYDNKICYSMILYCFINNIKEIPLCDYCNINKVKFISFEKGFYKACCISCSRKTDRSKQKRKNTMLDRYNCEYALSNKNIREKRDITMLNKYGTIHALKNKKLKEKYENTMIKKYGVKYPSNNDALKLKRKNAFIAVYGVDNPLKLEDVKIKRSNTMIEKYGVEYSFQSDYLKNKIKNTIKNKYGVENVMQCAYFFEKNQNSGHKFKNYIMPSGDIRKIQGYENFALDILLKEYKEEDLITSTKYMPKIWYYLDNKKHRYYPDIFIKSKNTFIEVKSIHTFKKEIEKNYIKKSFTIDQNYNHEIWIIDKKEIKEII